MTIKGKTPEISVVIPALNEAKYIHNVFDGLKKQTYKNFETIVVDGNSNDDTRRIARKYARVLIQHKRGLSFARNLGAKVSKGRIIVFLDADTKPLRTLLENYKKAFSDSEIVAATGPIYPLEKVKKSIFGGYKFVSVNLVKFSIKIQKPFLIGSNLAVLKHAFEKVKGFNNNYLTCEDWDLSQRIIKYGKIRYVDNAIVYTSARRTERWGILRYTFYTVTNLFRFYLAHKPNTEYEVIR
jgi:glycosyltransferase involved in cell wall biosynthesis